MAIQIGIGSWADPEYAELLHPRGLSADRRLSAYAMWFHHVEVNATYYALPKKEAVTKWGEATPDSFLFDIRLPRAISQSPEKAAADGRLLGYLFEGLAPLIEARKLGTFLLVLSPFFKPEKHRLEELDGLIEKLKPHPVAIELRHRAWVGKDQRDTTLAFFRERHATWVAVDMPQLEDSELMPAVDEVTTPGLAYLRLHGRNPFYLKSKTAEERHTYAYSGDDLQEIVKRIETLSSQAKNVRVVANNHASDFAPLAALTLKQMLGQFD